MMRFLALLLAVAALPAFAQDPARVVKPEIRVGDSWTYRTTNLLGPGTELDTMVRSPEAARAFPRRATFWYVPEVRRWVKFQVTTPKFTGVEELIEYKLNED